MNFFRCALSAARLSLFAALATSVVFTAIGCGGDRVQSQTKLAATTQPTPEIDPLRLREFMLGPDPTNVQGIVNRVHAIVVAIITSWDGAQLEGPYVNGVLTFPPTPVQGTPTPGVPTSTPAAFMESGYFSFEVERVLLDDGYVQNATSFRGEASEGHRFNPQVGKRYILSLFRNSDNRSYGAFPTFGLILLEDGHATRKDGSPFRFEAPTDESELLQAFEDAVAVRRDLSFGEWREPYADLPLDAE